MRGYYRFTSRYAVPLLVIMMVCGLVACLYWRNWAQVPVFVATIVAALSYGQVLDRVFESGYTTGVNRAVEVVDTVGVSAGDLMRVWYEAMDSRPTRREHEARMVAMLDELASMELPTPEALREVWERHHTKGQTGDR